jgi:hypothetical protein
MPTTAESLGFAGKPATAPRHIRRERSGRGIHRQAGCGLYYEEKRSLFYGSNLVSIVELSFPEKTCLGGRSAVGHNPDRDRVVFRGCYKTFAEERCCLSSP